jgi:hypothetical protein
MNTQGSAMVVLAEKKPGALTNASPTLPLGACGSNEIALLAYWEVADLMQKGMCQQARELALAIPIDHLRGLALLLVNYSRRL